MDLSRVQASLRLISRGFAELADALGDAEEPGETERTARVIREWGDRGLGQQEASALFRRHGFAPQTAGGWKRGDWIEIGEDGLRYLTAKSREWIAEHDGETEEST
ncbi:hypothetical protein [Amycolatopsis samaneae]|uniref:Uncharacterized protein n=1 Tax=Amycolatopsis samaneae TaxID=664691 RepID=A0ABW5GDR4_9PSEU